MAVRIGEGSFETLAGHVAFCLENIRHPSTTLAASGRFHEEASEALRAHAILRLLIDADSAGFSNDLVMSGHARRGYLRRCARQGHADYFGALSRSGAMLDAIAGNDRALAAEIFSLSPPEWRKGDEYEEDFCYQRFLGLHLSGAPPVDRSVLLGRFEGAAGGGGARLAICRALDARDARRFEEAFSDLLRTREEEIQEDRSLADEEVAVAVGTKVFIEGVAVLKLARHAGIPIAREYPMCPMLALLPGAPPTPSDEFAAP